MHICLLHGRIIFVQQNDDFLSIIPRKIVRQGVQGIGGDVILHFRRYLAEPSLFIRVQAIAFQQIIVLIVQVRDYLAYLFPGVGKGYLLYIRKGKADNGIGSL